MDLKLIKKNPALLKPNRWNANRVSAENQEKLDTSLKRLDQFKPILVRELPDGSLEIIGGHHRRDSAIRLGIKEVPVLSVGVIDDARAQEIGLADNERYGEDDADALKRLLDQLPTTGELHTFLPLSVEDIDSFLTYESIDLSEFDIEDEDDLPQQEFSEPSTPTHRIIRFKLAVEDAERLSQFIENTIKRQGYTGADALTNAGDALVHHIKELW